MAILLLFLVLFSFSKTQCQSNQYNISVGSTLSSASNSSWLSPSGLFAFGFLEKSNEFSVGIFLAGIPEKTVVWVANLNYYIHFNHRPCPFYNSCRRLTALASNATLVLTADGGLTLQAQGTQINFTDISEPIASASMLDNGNFVLKSSDGNITWQSFDHPSDTLLPGQILSAGQELFSCASETDYSKGIFRLKMQSDGNLVQYPTNSTDNEYNAYYSTGTSTYGSNVTLNLDNDGHLYLLNSTEIIKNINDGGSIRQRRLYMLRLDMDGILRVYSASLDNGRLITMWSSTDDKCAPKGRCGANSLCVPTDKDISCHCLPGFNFINEENQILGCERNFTEVSCKETNRTSDYMIQRLENTFFSDIPYASFDAINVDDCERNCMEDCNCGVAVFQEGGECTMQRLPLRFGRTDVKDSRIALIKMGAKPAIGYKVDEITQKITFKEQNTDVLVIGISLIVLAIIVLATGGVVLNRYHKSAYKKFNTIENFEIINDVTLHAFSYEQLVQITNNFSEQVGKGSSGTVYKGILSNCQKILAVKRLERELAEGEREFETEMRIIAKTYHRNLVSLVGYCIDGTKRLLVYEFMENGSLADVLFSQKDRLSWNERVRIALDIVKGILYLHEECKTQIIHCDIKPQNILMDESMCAKISDFGLAKLLKQNQSRTYTAARGTKGYVAPEWFRKFPVTVKVDVYSFGMVLLEIICHRRNVNWSLPENEVVLDEWVYNCLVAGELSKIVPDEEVDMKKLERWVKVGIWCIQDEPTLRPSMKEVLLMLEATIDVQVPPRPPSF